MGEELPGQLAMFRPRLADPMKAIVLRGDAASLPLPDASVDLIVTSPPYFGLRSYTDGGEHYDGQIGSEATPREYLDALLACTAEWMRVLKPEGSLFVNLGDKYAGAPSGPRTPMPDGYDRDSWRDTFQSRKRAQHQVRDKSLMGMPWRYALGCIDDLGLILRAEIIWAKPNGLPESVTDRVRRSHEQVFHFTRQPRYYSAVDEVREAHVRSWGGTANGGHTYGTMKKPGEKDANLPTALPNPLGKLPDSVWTIPSAPLTVPAHLGVDHFAAYPPELVRRIVLGWSPAAVCTACGQGRRPVVDKRLVNVWHDKPAQNSHYLGNEQAHQNGRKRASDPMMRTYGSTEATITGYACACPDATAPATPGTVLDPFGGTGTTALVASVHGRTGISVDRSADYCRLAQWRVSDSAERARALDVPKPPPVIDGQTSLFDVV